MADRQSWWETRPHISGKVHLERAPAHHNYSSADKGGNRAEPIRGYVPFYLPGEEVQG